MKNIFIFIFLFVLFLMNTNSYGQAVCPPNGISTNPDNAYNNQTPTKINRFDWRKKRYAFNYNNLTIPLDSLLSPFYSSQNIQVSSLYKIKDMKPEDGWELLTQEFGYDDNGNKKRDAVKFPFLVLYNKYTGLMRMFAAFKQSDLIVFGGFNSANIKLEMGIFRTSLLLPLNVSILDYDGSANITSAQSAIAPFDDFSWFYGDFQTNFDPCTCNQISEVRVSINVVKTSLITLDGIINGTITSVNNGNTADDNKKWSFSTENLKNAFEKGKQTYESIDAFKKQELEKIKGTDQKTRSSIPAQLLSIINLQLINQKTDKEDKVGLLTQAFRSSKFLTAGLKAAPYIGAAISAVEALVAGGNSGGPQQVEIMPMAINADIKMSGAITSETRGPSHIFATPGSKNAAQDPERAVYYNEVLGVLNILEKPAVDFTMNLKQQPSPLLPLPTYDVRNINSYNFRTNKPVEFVVNPAAGFKPNPEVQVAYVFEYDETFLVDIANGNYTTTALEIEGLSSLRTPYIPIKFLPDYSPKVDLFHNYLPSNFPGVIYGAPQPRKVYLKFIINLERKDAGANTQNVLYVVKYEVTTTQKQATPSTLLQNYPALLSKNLVFNNAYIQNNAFGFGGPSYKAYEKIEINNSNVIITNSVVTIYGPPSISFQSAEIVLQGETILDASLGGEIILETMSGLVTAPQSRVNSFCKDAQGAYQTNINRQNRVVGNPTTASPKTEPAKTPKSTIPTQPNLTAFPNPTTGQTTITYEVEKEGSSVSIYLSNSLGVRVMEVSNEISQVQGKHNVHIDTSSLASGIYFYTLVLNGIVYTERLVIFK